MARKLKDHGFTALRCEGGILPPEFLRTVSQRDARWQANADYGLTRSLNLRDEIGRYWRMANDLWIDYRERCERTDLNAERVGVEDWLLALLERVLGYPGFERCGTLELGERRFPIGYRSAGGAVPLVLTTRDYDLDRADPRFGEEGRRRPPHGLLQEYLNAEDACLWGVVSNGRVIRLLRDNVSLTRPAYLEADLERLFEEQLFADFAAFWLLFHASRIVPREPSPASCVLEGWRTESHATGERALAHLREGVTDALRQLGDGFLEHPDNDALRAALRDGELTAADYFQGLLRLVYRLLFLFTAEDRGLLFAPQTPAEARVLYKDGYALARLRERALKRRHYDAYSDLWDGLQVTFRGLAEGAPPLGLPALGGLFAADQCPRLDGSRIANARLLSTVRSLAFFATGATLARVNYRDMDTEELGSVYESLLELQPQVEVAPWRFAFVGDAGGEVKGTARKLTGSYYTPPALVAELIKSALVPVIERTLREHPNEPRAALLRLKVVDPACGSGHFLLAAARRLAAEIARLDAGPDTPGETLRQQALREVVRHGIYGVDRNPLAVELCRTALWMETVEPGKPLTFLDAHIRCGDSLVGVLDPAVMEDGIPDEAYKALTGDDKAVCAALKKRNKQSRGGGVQGSLFDQGSLQAVTVTGVDLDAMPEETLADIEAKRRAWERAEREAGYREAMFRANVFVGAFFAAKTAANAERVPVTEDLNRVGKGLAPRAGLAEAVAELAAAHRFFHWHLAFPEVLDRGGFDVVLGNPPWERIKLQEQEFFAARSPAIAGARNKAERDRLIKALGRAEATPGERGLYRRYLDAKHEAEAASLFVRRGGRFPLTAFGDVNLYALFAELFYRLRSEVGRAGIIVPSGIATDDNTKIFFGEITGEKQLVSLFDFRTGPGLFSEIGHQRYKFCLLTLAETETTDLAFFALSVSDLADKRRHFRLTPDDYKLINPNTRTCPVFRSGADAELTKKIYRRVPVLIDEAKGDKGNPWGIRFMAMFHMSGDSHLFQTAADLTAEVARRDGANWISVGGEVGVPLYEAKMIHQYDHRWATYEADGKTSRDVTAAERADGGFHVMPRYWVPRKEVEARLGSKGWKRTWLMGWRDIARSTDFRTVIAGAFPACGCGDKFLLMLPATDAQLSTCLLANLNTLPLDFCARQKVGGTSVKYFTVKQFPVLPPTVYISPDLDFIVPCVLELIYTARDMKPFAEDLGYTGPPFPFDPDRRALLRAELDAYYARLYGLTRDELRYILDPTDVYGEDFPSETFRVLKNNEMKAFGEYRTRRLVLEAWDRLEDGGSKALATNVGWEKMSP